MGRGYHRGARFLGVALPGLKSATPPQQKAEISRLRGLRPDLVAEYERRVETTSRERAVLLAGPYPGMGQGDPDLYKAFCWRF